MRNLLALALCGMLALGLSGCSAEGGEGSASAYIKDAPTDDWDAVHITVTEVSIHQSGQAGGNDTSGWKTLFSDSAGVRVDLLNLTGTRAAFLGETGLAPGRYQQVRIMVSDAHGVAKDGSSVDIAIPQKGYLHTAKSFKVDAGKETQVVIDIDLDKALVEKNGAWEFHGKIGKVYTHIKEKGSHPAEGEAVTVDLGDNAAQ